MTLGDRRVKARNHGIDTFYLGFKTFVIWVYSNRNRCAAVITILDKKKGLKSHSITSISDLKILYCRLIIFWFLKQTN